jgi:hypothetical protein
MRHKNKFTGILDKNGVKINNGDTVLVYHHNSYPKHPYNCTVVYKHGWKLKSNDDSIECLNLTLDLCRHDDNRKSLGLSEHGLVPLLVEKMKASTGEFRTQALGVLRKLSIATENRLYLGTEEFIRRN